MNHLDLLYRALLEYKKVTKDNKEYIDKRTKLKLVDQENESLEVIRYVCNVEEDWIEEIEKGLVFVEKAINEERQFITSNGEVIEIEKVKRVSKESVEHLAKHSNLITKIPEGENIIPDYLYTVEKLSDFAIYENRFLYMLLCHLKDFISLRYDAIIEKTNTYNAVTTINKTLQNKIQKTQFSLNFSEEIKNDSYAKQNNSSKSVIERIELILKSVLFYLKTPLMEEVAKKPMIKPPVTKTNILTMNQNFKGALALYDYIVLYTKPGYTIEKKIKKIAPFKNDLGDEFTDLILMTSFLTYEYSNDIKNELIENYQRYEFEKKLNDDIKKTEQLKRLKRQLEASEITPEEYIMEVERRNAALEKLNSQYVAAKQNIEELKEEIVSLNEKLTTINKLETELEELNIKYLTDMEAKALEYNQQVAELSEKHNQNILELTEKNNQYIADLKTEHAEEVSIITNRYEEHEKQIIEQNRQYVENLQVNTQKRIDEITESNMTLRSQMDDCNKELSTQKNEYNKLLEQKRFISASYNAIRRKYNLPELREEDFTTKERFKELEQEYKVYKKFFDEQWKKTKPAIRKKVFAENPYVPKKKEK